MTRLLEMRKIEIEGFSSEEEKWMPIIKGLDLTLDKGQVLGLIGDSGGTIAQSSDLEAELEAELVRDLELDLLGHPATHPHDPEEAFEISDAEVRDAG